MKFLDIIKMIYNIIMKVLENKGKSDQLKVDKNNREKDALKENKKKNSKLDKAIENDDIDTINSLLKSVVLVGLFILCGCMTEKVVYVDNSEKVELIQHNGIDGYFVPKTKMHELIKYKLDYEYYLKVYGPIN